MKRTTLLLALTLGIPALSTLGQSQGDQASQLKNPPAARDGEEVRKQDRPTNERRMRRGDDSREERDGQFTRPPKRRQGAEARGPQGNYMPGKESGAQRGPAWNSPQAGPRQFGPRPEVCPHCHRPFDLGMARGPQLRGRQGSGQEQNFGPMRRGLGPQARGPAFGPPPWAGRGDAASGFESGPRGPGREQPSMQGRGYRSTRRGFASDDAPADRLERPGPRGDERGSRGNPPADSDER